MFRFKLKKNKFTISLYRFLVKFKRPRDPFVVNYFKSNFSRSALISYVTSPFTSGEYSHHTNSQESIVIAKGLHNLGFNVDIINCGSPRKIDYKEYSLVFGFGKPFQNSIENTSLSTKKIFYSTGMPPQYNNLMTLRRGREFAKKYGRMAFKSLRYLEEDYSSQILLANSLITLGDDYVKKMYSDYIKPADIPVYQIPASFYKITNFKEAIREKDFKKAKNNFIFYSGGGLIHKGLDLILEYFATKPNINLHICASIINEREFEKYYYNLLYKTKNIIFHGFIDINGQKFLNLIKECAFIIFPSCSEGGGASVLNVLGNGGLIPIVTAESSIPIDDYGIPINGLNFFEISKAIDKTSSLSENEIREMSLKCGSYVSEHNSLENFEKQIHLALKKIVEF